MRRIYIVIIDESDILNSFEPNTETDQPHSSRKKIGFSDTAKITRTLFDISNAVNTTFNLDELYRSIHHSLGQIIDVSNFSIALYNEEIDTLTFVFAIYESDYPPYSSTEIPNVTRTGSLNGRVISTGKPIYLKKAARALLAQREGKPPVGPLSEVWLGVPLKVKNHVIGSMAVQSYSDPDRYDKNDVSLLLSISDQVAMAIDRKRVQEALQVEKAYLEQLIESAPEAIVLLDDTSRISRINTEFTQLFGYSASDTIGQKLDDLIAPDAEAATAAAYSQAIKEGERVTFEAERCRKDGKRVQVSCLGSVVKIDRKITGQYIIYRDISEQLRFNTVTAAMYTISKAANTAQNLVSLFETIHEAILMVLDSKDFAIALIDEDSDRVTFPYFADEMDDQYPILDTNDPGSLTTRVINSRKPLLLYQAQLDEFFATSSSPTYGSKPKIWLGVPLVLKGKVIGTVILQSYRDPTLFTEKDISLVESIADQIAIAIDRKRTEEALYDSELKYRTLFDHAGDAIFVHGKEGRFLDVNAVACTRYGYTKTEFLDMLPGDSPLLEINRQTENLWEVLRHEEQVITETYHTTRDGVSIPTELGTRRIEFNHQPAMLSIARDNTARKMAEEEKHKVELQLENARKMEAIGILAGGVAHDLNNILSGIVSYPDLLLMDLPKDSPLAKPLQTIQQSGQKAAAVVTDLLTLARRGVMVDEIVSLNQLISGDMYSPEYRALKTFHPNIEIITDLAPDLFNIHGSAVHLSKALLNLVTNAAEAINDKGRILIKTANRLVDKVIENRPAIKKGHYVTISVADNGIGISSEDKDHIFEPFYTKKVLGRSGTGLGMSVVWGTVQDHKGHIEVESNFGEGTIFTLFFPADNTAAKKMDTDTRNRECSGLGEKIVVVDDVPEQREIARAILHKLGYQVQTFPSGEDAVAYMQNNSADLLILDMIMDPGIDGLETYKRIALQHPGQKAIIVSGFSENGKLKELQRLGAHTFLKKPYLLETIGPAIRKELDRA